MGVDWDGPVMELIASWEDGFAEMSRRCDLPSDVFDMGASDTAVPQTGVLLWKAAEIG